MLEALVEEGVLHKQAAVRPNLPDRYFWMSDQYPANGITNRHSRHNPSSSIDREHAHRSIGQIDHLISRRRTCMRARSTSAKVNRF
ncbi:MAG: hypothetical protein U0559_05100 [Anaerolineae bacterium]